MGAPAFAAFRLQFTAKGDVVTDGEIYTTDASTGHTVPVIPSTYTAFHTVPVRSATGVWSVTMKEQVYKVLFAYVVPITTVANTVDVSMQPTTTTSTGKLVVNWTFRTVGTTTPADIGVSEAFQVFVVYSNTSVS